jgi:hypothetical protein
VATPDLNPLTIHKSYPRTVEVGLAVRLPSEAEWEYACRAGTETPFSFGENITPEQVNYDGGYPYAGGKKGLNRGHTVPVGSLPPNPWGLHEMHGNVWEWCEDWYEEYPRAPQVDPRGPAVGAGRVLRGGSWSLHGRYCRSAYRFRYGPALRLGSIGFRLALGQAASPGEVRAGKEWPAEQPRGTRGGDADRGNGKQELPTGAGACSNMIAVGVGGQAGSATSCFHVAF